MKQKFIIDQIFKFDSATEVNKNYSILIIRIYFQGIFLNISKTLLPTQ